MEGKWGEGGGRAEGWKAARGSEGKEGTGEKGEEGRKDEGKDEGKVASPSPTIAV